MPFTDYLTVMLLNMVAGLVLLAGFVVWGLDAPRQKHWAGGFGIVGFVALATGLHMTLTWPLSGRAQWANIAFGEPTVLLGATFLGAAVCLAAGWSLRAVGTYGAIAGIVAIVVGILLVTTENHEGELGLTKVPALSMSGFVLSGLGAIAVCAAIFLPRVKPLRWLAGLILLAAAGIWMLTGLGAYAGHISRAAGAG
jgi:putative membrane protein